MSEPIARIAIREDGQKYRAYVESYTTLFRKKKYWAVYVETYYEQTGWIPSGKYGPRKRIGARHIARMVARAILDQIENERDRDYV